MRGDPSKILERTPLHRGCLTVERVRLTTGHGEEVVREVESHGDAAAVLPYDPVRRCAVLARLPRAPVLLASGVADSLEACAGMIGRGDAEATARREAYKARPGAGRPEVVGRVWATPGVTTERVSLFLATYRATDRLGEGGGVAAKQEISSS